MSKLGLTALLLLVPAAASFEDALSWYAVKTRQSLTSMKDPVYTSIEDTDSLKVFKITKGPATIKAFLIEKKAMKFGVSTIKPASADFYINSNFFHQGGIPMGEVVSDGKRTSKRRRGGSYFYVKRGMPVVSRRPPPRRVNHSTQTILRGITSGKLNKRLFRQKHAKVHTFRSLVGENKDQIIVIVSDSFGLLTIEEICEIGKKLGVREGALFDGGTSIDYKFRTHKKTHRFQSIPTLAKFALNIDDPPVYIYANFN